MSKTKNSRHDYSGILVAAAILVTTIRYAGAFLVSDLGSIEGVLSTIMSYGMGITGLGMGLLDVLGGAYIFDGWRRTMPATGKSWPFRFKVLTIFVFGLILSGIFILVPYTVSRVLHRPIGEVLGEGGWLWAWSLLVNLAPYLLIGGVVTGNTGMIGVNKPESGQGQAESSQGQNGNLPENLPDGMQVAFTDWRKVPEDHRKKIATMRAEEIVSTYGVEPRTARNWRTNAQNEFPKEENN